MKMPHGNEAVVPARKLTDYLLSLSHPVGSAKAVLFRSLGFDDSNVPLFEKGLLTVADNGDVVEIVSSPHGTKYIIDGPIAIPRGGILAIRTVWIAEPDDDRPRFVTAYPK